MPCKPTCHRHAEGSGAPREGVWGTVHWDQHSYLCPPVKRTCPGHHSPDLQCHWAGSSPPRAFGRLVPEADGVRVSFPGVIACLAPCPGLLIPLLLLSPPQPQWRVAPLLLQSHQPTAHATATAVSCSSRQCPACPQRTAARLQRSPKAMSSPRDMAVAPEAAGNDSASNYPRGSSLACWRME